MKHSNKIVDAPALDEALRLQSRDISRALQLAETAYANMNERTDPQACAHAEYVLGSLIRLAGSSYRRAERLLLDALSRLHPDATLRRGVLVQLGQLYIELEKFGQASVFLSIALKDESIDQDPEQHANILLSLAITKVKDKPNEARSLLDSALLIFSGVSNQKGIALTMMVYAGLLEQSNSSEAIDMLTYAAHVFGDIGEERSRGVALQKLAEVHLANGSIPQATSAIQSVLAITERSQLLSLRVDALITYTKILDIQGKGELAVELAEEADSLAAAIGRVDRVSMY